MATILDAQGRVYASELLPQKNPDSQQPMARGNGRGEAIVQPSTLNKAQLAIEGSYFITSTQNTNSGAPTTTKQLLGAATVAFADTGSVLAYLFNPGPANAVIDYLKLVGLLAHTGATDALYVMIVKDVARALSTDNTALFTPNPVTTIGNVAPKLQVKFQNSATASVIAASTPATRQVVASEAIPRLVGVLGDTAKIVFGSWDGSEAVQSTQATPTTPGRLVVNAGPLVIEPGRSATIHVWQPGNTIPAQAYVELGHFER